MPIYEYRRPDGSTFEVMQSFADDPLTHDPETGVEVQRVLHAPAVHFKGKGFYNTDYGTRKRQRESAASTEGSGSSVESGSGGEKSSASDGGAGKDGGGSGGETSSNGKGPTKSKSEASSAKDSKPKAAAGKS
jgi:putative FmdB family regulatory protein